MGKQLFKSIRSRTIWTLVVTFLILMIMVVIIMNTLMIKSIDALEHRTLAEQMDQISIGIGFELSDLKKTAVDWAEWDDPYQFVEDGNQTFIDENLGTYLFDNLRLDAMIFINSAGDFVYAQQKSTDETGIAPVPDPVKQALQQLIGNNLDAEKKLQGILKIPGGAMLFATNPILTSNGDGPVHGNIVLYRYLNEMETAYLSQMIGSDFSLGFQTSLDSMALSLDNANTISNVEMHAISVSTIRGVATLHDFYGNPAAIVELDLNRDLSMIANSSAQSVLIALLASCIISMLIIIRFTSSVILSRVISMSSSIRRIGENFDTKERLKPDGYCDELSADRKSVV